MGDGRLLWLSDSTSSRAPGSGFHVTSPTGADDVTVDASFQNGKESFDGVPRDGHGWVVGDQYWFLVYQDDLPGAQGTAYTLYQSSFSRHLVKVGDDVVAADAADGALVWVTTKGTMFERSIAGGAASTLHVPFDHGCRMPPLATLQNSDGPSVSAKVVALPERCGTGQNATDDLLMFDLAGRRIARVTGLEAMQPTVVGDTVLFEASSSDGTDVMRYDLRTGRLARLGKARQILQRPSGAGDYVLWYDTKGGHVARIPQ